MTAKNYTRSFELVVGHEAGFTDSPHDRGNWTSGRKGVGELKGTKYGISAMAYPQLDIINLTLEQAETIYRSDYWNPVRGDQLPSGIDYAVFDCAVNQGIFDASVFLQFACGATPDGIVGPLTLNAVRNTDPADLLKEFSARRMEDYMNLSHLVDLYGLGWSRRLVDVTITAFTQLPE